MQDPSDRHLARSVFKFSILYLMLLCAGMAVDTLPAVHGLTASLTDHLQMLVSALPISGSFTP
ncbi:hypothetical protein [Neosynechococcus sphagnicola]|uniref:hypothetical protein n=1 Tax=Neosynechococcus sphagnicola TaxID=1501145 RepID=UPI000ADA4C57